MGRSIALSVVVAIACAIIIWGLGRLLDSATLSSVAIAAGAGAGVGYFITTRNRGGPGRGPGRDK
jgi:UDP-N-acetylmuramyl pentapeptide phosphotransferase/UDP-N-acetylglucosamine-1-phosphate transferase